MSTEYNIKCVPHGDIWPDGGVYSYHIPQLLGILANRRCILKVSAIGDMDIGLMGAYSDLTIAEYLAKHRRCKLLLADEYGRLVLPS